MSETVKLTNSLRYLIRRVEEEMTGEQLGEPTANAQQPFDELVRRLTDVASAAGTSPETKQQADVASQGANPAQFPATRDGLPYTKDELDQFRDWYKAGNVADPFLGDSLGTVFMRLHATARDGAASGVHCLSCGVALTPENAAGVDCRADTAYSAHVWSDNVHRFANPSEATVTVQLRASAPHSAQRVQSSPSSSPELLTSGVPETVTDERRVVSVMADGLIVVHDDATEEEINRAFLRITQFLTGDMEGLRKSAVRPAPTGQAPKSAACDHGFPFGGTGCPTCDGARA